MKVWFLIFCRDDDDESKVVLKGRARMAHPINDFVVLEVNKPNVGENKPSSVKADIKINTASTVSLTRVLNALLAMVQNAFHFSLSKDVVLVCAGILVKPCP